MNTTMSHVRASAAFHRRSPGIFFSVASVSSAAKHFGSLSWISSTAQASRTCTAMTHDFWTLNVKASLVLLAAYRTGMLRLTALACPAP